MSITTRDGPFGKFIPTRLITGEWATVTSGDPHAADGKAEYKCFSPGVTKRMATYEDMKENINNSITDIQEAFTAKMEISMQEIIDTVKGYEDAVKLQVEISQGVLSMIEASYATYYEVRNPWTGARMTIQEAFEDYFRVINELHGNVGLTAAEYAALDLTATAYDTLDLMALDYDSNGKNLIGV